MKPEVIDINSSEDQEEEEEEIKADPVPVPIAFSDDEDFKPVATKPETKRKRVSKAKVHKRRRISEQPPPPKKKQQVVRIFYTTRTHAQITKAVQELRKTEYKPIMSILGSRKQYCIHHKVSKLVNKDQEW